MFCSLVFLAVFNLVCSENATSHAGKQYYFKMGRNNEYRVHNRIFYLNHNITDSVNPHAKIGNSLGNNNLNVLKNEQQNPILNDPGQHYLDEEWNYNHNHLPRTNLPLFIRKFYEKSLDSAGPKSTKRILFNDNKNKSNIMYFNLNSLQSEAISDADLYFYWPLENSSSIYKESVVLRLYQFEKQYDLWNQSGPTENPDIHKLFNVIYVSKAQKGWQTFKVKKPIDNWLGGEENLGLLLTISYYENNTLIEVFNDTNSGNISTFIIANVQTNSTKSSDIVTHPDHTEHSGVRQCRKQEWTIDFLSMGWNKFIIAPEYFNAFDCTGRCVKNVDENSNHAKLVHTLQKRTTCCIPVEYKDLVIMYYDKYGNVAIKSYNDIVATECGCR
ncbi:unnamed protein product [Phaedon cochleariae]|uniref:TGF-beta family profile domain-containing protein n=1 Tax=Phaedon cochleariae TaxID=80249 RepID=A0A9P0GSF8_PHACE|nr:unnamed protein product [Phaedon cochleariae]